MLLALVPQHINVDDGHVERQGADDQFVAHIGHADEVARQHGQQVGLGHDAAGGEKLVHGEHDAALTLQ